MLTEDRGVDGEEAGEGDVGEEGEAAAGDEPNPELLGLDPAQLLGQPRLPPLAGAGRRLGPPRVRRGRHGSPTQNSTATTHDRFPGQRKRTNKHTHDASPRYIGRPIATLTTKPRLSLLF